MHADSLLALLLAMASLRSSMLSSGIIKLVSGLLREDSIVGAIIAIIGLNGH